MCVRVLTAQVYTSCVYWHHFFLWAELDLTLFLYVATCVLETTAYFKVLHESTDVTSTTRSFYRDQTNANHTLPVGGLKLLILQFNLQH